MYRYSKKHGVPLYQKANGDVRLAGELTEHQIILQNWLFYYDWIMSGEGPPIPDEDTLEDDQALDDYVDQWKINLKKQKEGQKSSKSFKIG